MVPQSQATGNKKSVTCWVGFNWGVGTSAFSRSGVWRGWGATGDPSQDEWAQCGDLWGAADPRPLQQGPTIDHHWGPIKEGMWLKQACVEQWSMVWPTCLSSWASVPLIDGVDSLCMVHKALSVPPPLDRKGGFLQGGRTHYHVAAFFPPSASSPHQLNGLCGWHGLYVCVWTERGGGKLQRKKAAHWVTLQGGEHTQHITREHLVGGMCTWCQMIVQR